MDTLVQEKYKTPSKDISRKNRGAKACKRLLRIMAEYPWKKPDRILPRIPLNTKHQPRTQPKRNSTTNNKRNKERSNTIPKKSSRKMINMFGDMINNLRNPNPTPFVRPFHELPISR